MGKCLIICTGQRCMLQMSNRFFFIKKRLENHLKVTVVDSDDPRRFHCHGFMDVVELLVNKLHSLSSKINLAEKNKKNRNFFYIRVKSKFLKKIKIKRLPFKTIQIA
jgi:hypothetical protein